MTACVKDVVYEVSGKWGEFLISPRANSIREARGNSLWKTTNTPLPGSQGLL